MEEGPKKKKRFSVEQTIGVLKKAQLSVPAADVTLDKAMLQDALKKWQSLRGLGRLSERSRGSASAAQSVDALGLGLVSGKHRRSR